MRANNVIVTREILVVTKYSDEILEIWPEKKLYFAGKKTLGSTTKILITDLHLKPETF